MTQDFLSILTGSPDSPIDFRLIHDTDKGEQGINLRGTLAEHLQTLQAYNAAGWGVFYNINAMKTDGRKTLENVDYIRAHVVDLDDPLTSQDAYNRAVASDMPPHLAVQTSPRKYHLYWLVEPYTGNEFYNAQQRKLAQLYNGDTGIIDPTRVLRVPGFNHCKNAPTPVTCWQISDRPRYTHAQIEQHLQHVNVIQHYGNRKPLGTPELAAPSLEWLTFALGLEDPNDLERGEWMPLSAAFKQAGWSLADEQTLLTIWLGWCAQYEHDDAAENMKLWNSIRDSEVGWGRFERLTMVKAWMNNAATPPDLTQLQAIKEQAAQLPDRPQPTDTLPEILDAHGKQIWFKDCYFIAREGKIFSQSGRFMNSTQFNGLYGGKEFSIKDAGGKVTDEPWKAALRATDWQIPKVDHIRFLPSHRPYEIIIDELGRTGLNTYIPAHVPAKQGDISMWIDYLNRIFPCESDAKIFNDYIAHSVRYPGHKIPWAFLLQSAEGIGKKMIGKILKHCIGQSYTYQPNAEQLVSSGSKFNAWMRCRLMIIVDEIRVGERFDLVEVLKPMITDEYIEVQAKGVDQDMEDNVANWLFFSNYKDAVPIKKNGRRYSVSYSRLQTESDIINAGMTKEYFDAMYQWLEEREGLEAIAHYYLTYPIERGSLPHRAPHTSSHAEALLIGRSPLEVVLDDKIAAAERGFRGGYVSFTALLKIADQQLRKRPPDHAIKDSLVARGYQELGYTVRPVAGEDMSRPSLIFGLPGLSVADYERSQS